MFILSPQPLRPTTEIFRLLCSSVVANSKTCCGRSRNSSIVESQGYFILEWPFLQFHEQRAKFTNEVNHVTRFFEKVDSWLPSRSMMLEVSGQRSAVIMTVGWLFLMSVVLLYFLEFQPLPERKIDWNCLPEASLCGYASLTSSEKTFRRHINFNS